MENELLKHLLDDPWRWPFYVVLAAFVIIIYKVINALADAVVKRLSEKMRKKKWLLSLAKMAWQLVVIALVIYTANAVYWSRAIGQLLPSPSKKPINTCEATVEITTDSGDKGNTHFMDSGGYLAFCSGDKAILVTSAPDSWSRSLGGNQCLIRGLFKMDATDAAVGKTVGTLRDAQYIQVEFRALPKDASVIGGKAMCVINGEVRIDMPIPSQKALDGKVFVRNLVSFKEKLK
ncbi:MAG: hypothetical protein WA117_02565 [Verrucomicrobiia bacterium]